MALKFKLDATIGEFKNQNVCVRISDPETLGNKGYEVLVVIADEADTTISGNTPEQANDLAVRYAYFKLRGEEPTAIPR